MAGKYRQLDRKLFAWLRANRDQATTAAATQAIGATSKTHQRHVSRRFTQLEDRGVLHCVLRGTTRICQVVDEIPVSLSKQPWRQGIARDISNQMGRPDPETAPAALQQPAIPANDSSEYEARGGTVERLESCWDRPRIGKMPLGPSFFDDFD